jgi:tRNA A-37 threonylcarbamoyl transferase component Bud32
MKKLQWERLVRVHQASNQAVISSLASDLVPHITEWYGESAALDSESFTVRTNPYSFFIGFPVKTSVGIQTLLVKIHRKPHIGTLTDALTTERLRKIARDEYEISQVIWQAFAEENSPVCIPVQYLGFIEKWNALLMRKIEGKMLKKYLLRPSIALRNPKSLAQLQSYLLLSTHWLNILHRRVSGLRIVPFPVEKARLLIEEVLSKLSERSNGQVDIRPFRAALEKELEAMHELHLPVGLLHADFHYSNILVTPDERVCVLDYALNYYGPIYFDLATILIDPETRQVQILTGGRLIAPDFLQSCKRLILSAYFNGKPYLENVLNFYCALAILNKWSTDETGFSNSWRRVISPLLSRMTRQYYAKLVLQYL